jgi:5-methylcytosine-specific restriction endonuclease McrA
MVAPLSADRYRVQFTDSREVCDRLREAQDLLAREVPADDLNAIIGQALDLLVRELRHKRFAETARPRQALADCDGTRSSAHVPNAIRRAVAARDGSQCTFVDAVGRRCPERRLLELHHCDPQGRGGAHRVETLTLRCQQHHALATEREYGAAHVAAAIAARRATRSSREVPTESGGEERGRAA